MECFPFIFTSSTERYYLFGFIACYSSLRKVTRDLTVSCKKLYLHDNNNEYGGHDVISFPRLYYMIICTTYVDSQVDASLYRD